VFFEDLTSKRPLTWIGALPDALEKATNQDEVKDILGADVTRESFDDLPTCEGKIANARCYTIVSELKLFRFEIIENVFSWTDRQTWRWTPVTRT